MASFAVKSVTKQDDLTVVAVEPVKQTLILGDEIPPGCIQHVVSNLLSNASSKEDCNRMCDVLCNINMNDDDSRN